MGKKDQNAKCKMSNKYNLTWLQDLPDLYTAHRTPARRTPHTTYFLDSKCHQ